MGEQNDIIPILAPEQVPTFFVTSQGLKVRKETLAIDVSWNGEILVPKGKPVSVIDFMPNGTIRFDPTRMTESLLGATQAMQELVSAIDHNKVELPRVFWGITTVRMAKLAERIGFTIISPKEKYEKSTNKEYKEAARDLATVQIFGKYDEICTKLNTYISRLPEIQRRLERDPVRE